MRILVTVPWGRRLGGSEEMLQRAIDGAADAGHELDLIFLEPGPWAAELASLRAKMFGSKFSDCSNWLSKYPKSSEASLIGRMKNPQTNPAAPNASVRHP